MKKTLLLSIVSLLAVSQMLAQITNPLVLNITTTPATACTPPCNGTATVASVTGGIPPYTYLWNIPLAPQTTPTATGLCPGTYQIGVFDAGTPLPSQGQAMVTITCLGTTSTSNIEEENLISVFPNPAQSELNIEVLSTDFTIESISIFNVVGVRVFHEPVSRTATLRRRLDVSRLNAGMYFIVLNNNERRIRSKFLKE